jgi:hypothetical protein
MPKIPNLFLSGLDSLGLFNTFSSMVFCQGNLYIATGVSTDRVILKIDVNTKSKSIFLPIGQPYDIKKDLDNNLYFSGFSGSVYKTGLDGNNSLYNTSETYPYGLDISDGNLYISTDTYIKVSRLSDNYTSTIPIGNGGLLTYLAVDTNNNCLYFCKQNKIGKYDLNGTIIDDNIATTLDRNIYLRFTIANNFMYASTNGGTIDRINLSTGEILHSIFNHYQYKAFDCLAIDGQILYAGCALDSSIYKFQLPIPPQKDDGMRCSTRNGKSVSVDFLQKECDGQKVLGTSLIHYTCSKKKTSYIVDKKGLLRRKKGTWEKIINL